MEGRLTEFQEGKSVSDKYMNGCPSISMKDQIECSVSVQSMGACLYDEGRF